MKRAPVVVYPPSPTQLYATVALNRPFEGKYSYLVPGAFIDQVRIGSMVEVPLKSQTERGVVVDLTSNVEFKGPIKPIARLLTPEYAIPAELISLARWISEYYWCSLGEALSTAAFVGLNDVHAKMRSHLVLSAPDHWLAISREVGPDGKKVSAKQASVIHALLACANEPMSTAELREDAGVSVSVIETMLDRGWLLRVQEPVPVQDDYAPDDPDSPPVLPMLTTHQATAVDQLLTALNENTAATYLLHGVTGSGKTEVYLRAIEEALRLGRSAIVLVPEIALTPQTVGIFRARLGSLVGVYHSRLTLPQKYDLWKKIVSGEIRVLAGARSAIFAPLPNLGVIIVDEEHESSYKQGDTPRYHARDVAVLRASRLGALTVLGSATPSLESFANARDGKYKLLELPDRVGPHASPVMTVIDMKRNLVDSPGGPGKRSIGEMALISPQLQGAIEDRLRKGEQTVLLLNRRGFANQVICLRCEQVVQCPHCDVSLTYHKALDKLMCHWCGHSTPMPKYCPNPKCGAPEIQAFGLGTQKIEELLATLFPGARSLRIDVDSMKGRRSFIEAWEKITRREVDIILGTQMIAKGFHLESVTLVGVISADFALFMPDFRSAERTFHLLTQVAGRAGRGDKPGEVIVQSYLPHHYAIEYAARLALPEFYQREMHIRKMLRFPPVARLISLLLSGEDQQLVREQSGRLANQLKSLALRPAYRQLQVLGPAPAPIGKLEDQYRWRMLLRGPSFRELHELLRQGLIVFEEVHQKTKVHLTIDVDPVDMM